MLSAHHQQHQHQLPLSILSAVYGKADVTNKVRSQASQNSLSIKVDNGVLGDTWPGTQKALVVVYQFGYYKPDVAVAKEGETLTINHHNCKPEPWYLAPQGTLAILGAAYGVTNVTDAVTSKVHGNSLNISVDNSQLGDGWPGVPKVLAVTFLNIHGIPVTAIVEEGGHMKISNEQQHHSHGHTQGWDHPHLNILSAVYGKKNVTDEVRSRASRDALTIKADNETFGDPWPGVQKALVVVYQYGFFKPQLTIVQEGGTITINPQSYKFEQWYPPHKGQMLVLGAAYGISNVTDVVNSRVKGHYLDITADNNILGDGWPGVRKTLVVVALSPKGVPVTVIEEEGGHVKLDQHAGY